MASRKKEQPRIPNTEEKIKMAARIVFYKKGFAATRTRDIAKEAEINVALLNYYFRSKEKLFQLIMIESLTKFYENMGGIFNNEETSLLEKITLMAEKYIDLMISEPEMPVFIMSEIRQHGAELLDKLPIGSDILKSVFIRQYKEAVKKGNVLEPHPIQFLANLGGLIIFPFINSPMLKKAGKLNDKQFEKLMHDRKKLVPVWIKAMFKVK